MIWDVIGVTRWTLEQISAMTLTQLSFVQEGRGFILYPQLEPQINANLANLSDESVGGQPSGVDRVIEQHQRARADREAGIKRQLSVKEQRSQYARRILLAAYLGDPDAVQEGGEASGSAAFPGMGRDEAQAWVSWVNSGKAPAFVWLEVAGVYPNIWAASLGGES